MGDWDVTRLGDAELASQNVQKNRYWHKNKETCMGNLLLTELNNIASERVILTYTSIVGTL